MVVLLIGLLSGLANGLFGAGGGTIIVPSIERFLNVDEHKAHSSSIAVILPLSVLSAFIYLKNESIDWHVVFYITIGGIIGGFIGAKLLNKLSAKWLHRIFGLFMIVAAIRMIL